ncbi:MAG: asparagine synthase (glutamine-hydrolyzing) [Elusimicrobia bacterium]|nr:asparagine synthase (glutamine-hydrolyzing) [Elusimicrobiota bacterium]
MCGIAGIVGPSADAARMRRMRDMLVHRGPDSEGEIVLEGAALGIRRLKIIDLVTGDQPQSNEDGTIWTVFNGEIYNFLELRAELVARGHHFRTASDTEVIVHLYEDLGDDFVARLDGMFALAVWDSRRRILVLARDRLGKKPLLYRVDGDRLAFASEHRSLLHASDERPALDREALVTYLRLGYVPAPHDIFRAVRKVRPGHVLTWHDGLAQERPYWRLPEPGTLEIPRAEAVEEIRRLLRSAVAKRLMSDVPLGAFLSGGLDSSSVVAIMSELSGRVRTFTIDFAERAFSEARYARLVADRFGTDHLQLTVQPQDIEVISRLVQHYGEPFADSSALPTYYLARMTRESVTVALNGDGGDEIFAGYQRYVAVRLADRLGFVPPGIRRAVSRTAAKLPPVNASVLRLRRFAAGWQRGSWDRYLSWIELFDDATLRSMLEPELHASLPDIHPPREGLDGLTTAQVFDISRYLPDDLLVKADIASMANSLEVRSPLLDRQLVEFVIRLPVDVRMPGLERKSLLREAMRGSLPGQILDRAKQGFGVPIGAWWRGPLRAFTTDVLLSSAARTRGHFLPGAVERLVRAHLTEEADHAHRIWGLMSLELWHREFIDGAPHVPADVCSTS